MGVTYLHEHPRLPGKVVTGANGEAGCRSSCWPLYHDLFREQRDSRSRTEAAGGKTICWPCDLRAGLFASLTQAGEQQTQVNIGPLAQLQGKGTWLAGLMTSLTWRHGPREISFCSWCVQILGPLQLFVLLLFPLSETVIVGGWKAVAVSITSSANTNRERWDSDWSKKRKFYIVPSNSMAGLPCWLQLQTFCCYVTADLWLAIQ